MIFDFKINKNAFTLIELIITISIISILFWVWYIAFESNLTTSKDVYRLEDVVTIKSVMSLTKEQNWWYPYPNNYFTIINSWITNEEVYQWYINSNVLISNLSNIPKDPTTWNQYILSTTKTKQQYQIGLTLENNKTNKALVDWDYNANSLYLFPSLILAEKWTWIVEINSWSVTNNSTWSINRTKFILNWSKINLPYTIPDWKLQWQHNSYEDIIWELWTSISRNSDYYTCKEIYDDNLYLWPWYYDLADISWSWYINWFCDWIFTWSVTISNYSWTWNWIDIPFNYTDWTDFKYPQSCNDILVNTVVWFSWANNYYSPTYSSSTSSKFKNWVYTIDPDWASSFNKFNTYCDMNTDNWGYSLCFSDKHFARWTAVTSWYDFTYSNWTYSNNWNTVFLSWGQISNYWNFCNSLSFNKLYSSVYSNITTPSFSTNIMNWSGIIFSTTWKASYSSWLSVISIWNRTALELGYYQWISCSEWANTYTQWTSVCVTNGSKFQIISGNLNWWIYWRWDRMCNANSICQQNSDITVLFFVK